MRKRERERKAKMKKRYRKKKKVLICLDAVWSTLRILKKIPVGQVRKVWIYKRRKILRTRRSSFQIDQANTIIMRMNRAIWKEFQNFKYRRNIQRLKTEHRELSLRHSRIWYPRNPCFFLLFFSNFWIFQNMYILFYLQLADYFLIKVLFKKIYKMQCRWCKWSSLIWPEKKEQCMIQDVSWKYHFIWKMIFFENSG